MQSNWFKYKKNNFNEVEHKETPLIDIDWIKNPWNCIVMARKVDE